MRTAFLRGFIAVKFHFYPKSMYPQLSWRVKVRQVPARSVLKKSPEVFHAQFCVSQREREVMAGGAGTECRGGVV